jgi:hypothetical protein
MVAFWDVLALVLLLVSIAFVVLTVVLIVGLVWTKVADKWSENAVSWVRAAMLGIAGLLFLALARGVFSWEHPTLDFSKDKSDVLTAVGTVSGDVVTATIAGTTLYALILLRKAVSEQVKQLKASAVQNVGQEMLKIDMWMADNVNYIDKVSDEKYSQIGAAVAEVHADLIAQVLSQRDYLPTEHMEFWEEYFRDLIRKWPQLEQFLKKNHRWYEDTMKELSVDQPAK